MDFLMDNAILLIIVGAVGIPVLIYALLGVGERILDLLPHKAGHRLRPLVWLFLPLALIILILLYPVVSTIRSSFMDATDAHFVGFDNYVWAFQGDMLGVIGNNIVWVVVLPLATVVMALIAAVLFDRVAYERVAMTLILLPTAISFVAGAVIWTQMYAYQPAGSTQLGTFNALLTALVPGFRPISWLQTPMVNTLAMILIAVWLQLGIAVLILSAAVKNVDQELLEAARLDGANELRVFFSITLPVITPAVLVVLTTAMMAALKIFDIVYVLTNGLFESDVIANRLYSELFHARDYGHASVIAVILLVAALPIVLLNVAQFRSEGE